MDGNLSSTIVAKAGGMFIAATGVARSDDIAAALGQAPPEWWHLVAEGGPVALMIIGVWFLYKDRERMITEIRQKGEAMDNLHRELLSRMDRHAESILRIAEHTDQDLRELMIQSTRWRIEDGKISPAKVQSKLKKPD